MTVHHEGEPVQAKSFGTVSQWFSDEGWGVIESLDTPGGCWAHFSVVFGKGNELRTLTVGAVVPFTWESDEQDGFSFRATSVGSGQALTTTAGPSAAYSSTLTISYDQVDGFSS